jgi:hypothetical protein
MFIVMLTSAIGEMFFLRYKVLAYPETRHFATYCQIVLGVLVVYLVPNMFINRQDFDLMYQIVAVEAGLAVLVRQKLAEQRAEVEEIVEAAMPLWLRAQQEQ